MDTEESSPQPLPEPLATALTLARIYAYAQIYNQVVQRYGSAVAWHTIASVNEKEENKNEREQSL